jgi:ABC-type Fe3+ transport system substrate-binding protein
VLAESLAKGKLSIIIGLTYYSFRQFVTAGLPVKPLPTFKEGTYVSGVSGNLAIIKNPPHPNAAKVFVNWLLGKEGQEVFHVGKIVLMDGTLWIQIGPPEILRQ